MRRWLLLLFVPLAGCDRTSPTTPTANITGQVVWNAEIPQFATFRSLEFPLGDNPAPPPPRVWANPNLPQIEPSSRQLAGAIVWLQSADGKELKAPGAYAPVAVTLREHRFELTQGKRKRSKVGLVRRGESVKFQSQQELFHSVQIRGANFAARTLPRLGDESQVTFNEPGITEMVSGAGYFWMRAYLLVTEHPWAAITDDSGRFELANVPAGEYRVVAWHPNWRVKKKERNPDNFRIQYLQFEDPLMVEKKVTLKTDDINDLKISFPNVAPRMPVTAR
jgi:hypothetical protein